MKLSPLFAFLALSLAACSEEPEEQILEATLDEPAETPARTGGDRRRPGGGGERPSSKPSGETPDELAPVDPTTVGSIQGTVLFQGDPPKRKEIGTGTEAACNVHATPPKTESAVVENGRVRDVYVYIKRGHEGWIVPEPPAEPVTLSQEGCIYVPHALAVQTGQKLLVHNGDDTTHNVNMKAKRNGINGNYTQGRKQADLEFVFERREHLIPFKCDIHPWMGAQLYVQDHPWFALTDAEGNFNIEGVPPGDYTLEAVHETFGKLKADITVAAGSPATAAFSYTD